mgnify:CR=1 FL=1
MAPSTLAWRRLTGTVAPEPGKRVRAVTVRFVVNDASGTAWVTDAQLQDGSWPTGHVVHEREILELERLAVPLAYNRGVQLNRARYNTRVTWHVLTQRHYNCVVRGRQVIAVPNRAPVADDPALWRRVPGALDVTVLPAQPLPPGALRIAHQYRTRELVVPIGLRAGDELSLRSTERAAYLNGARVDAIRTGWPICAPGFGRFIIEMVDGDEAEGSLVGSGVVLLEVDTWLLAHGGQQL